MYENNEQGRDPHPGEPNRSADAATYGPSAFTPKVQEDVSAAAKAAEDYRSKVFEYMRVNVNAALDYANSLAGVKSPADIIGLGSGHAGKPAEPAVASDPDVSAAAKAAEEYRAQVFEFMKANMNATLEYALRLASVKSPSEFIELSTSHARKQFETVTAQTRARRDRPEARHLQQRAAGRRPVEDVPGPAETPLTVMPASVAGIHV